MAANFTSPKLFLPNHPNGINNLIGRKFFQLLVVDFHKSTPGRHCRVYWKCLCDCGNKTIVRGDQLKRTQSCGCLQKQMASKANLRHGYTGKSEYKIWGQMLDRCRNPQNPHYCNYGGRGISVDPRWLSFENFIKDMGDRPHGLTLDRIDNNGNYCKDNCQWISLKDQQRNKRNNRLITYQGKTLCLSSWAIFLNMPRNTLDNRITRGWTIEDAFTRKIQKRK